ncbi:hypothetical protein M0R72_01040 [Candidatus Pacearchaeota archaeon]|jgi:hypothetical protein|nr:hypothetical protein [Candidatus Pacearchaeota archaeon]
MADDKDKGFIVMGPELPNGGRAAIHVDKEGVHHGEMFREGEAPECAEGELTRIRTEQIAGPIYQVTEEEPIGKPLMVNSLDYRNNWNNIFGKKQDVGEA